MQVGESLRRLLKLGGDFGDNAGIFTQEEVKQPALKRESARRWQGTGRRHLRT